MTEIVSVKFKNRGKSYYFSPEGLEIKSGETVIVETSKGLELADCVMGNHTVNDDAVIQPLRPVIRKATEADMKVAQTNKAREKEAFAICQQQIEEHGLDMKLVDVECNFEGNKTTFFFTSDGRVDFRELVKDLAGIFRNRIERRQIGVRDEAKMLGGIGICGRPYCCSQFLDDFQPVSTKMAKTQSLSLNPTKISGSCGRLMCCLRYEQDAYEELVKNVPKQGAYVETKDGYGTAVQVNLLRQTVKVKLDDDEDLHIYKPNELAAVPGGRPKDGEQAPSVLHYVPEEEKEEELTGWEDIDETPSMPEETPAAESGEGKARSGKRNRRRRQNAKREGSETSRTENAKQPDNTKQPRQKHIKVKEKTGEGSAEKAAPAADNVQKAPEQEKKAGNKNKRPYRGKPRRKHSKPSDKSAE